MQNCPCPVLLLISLSHSLSQITRRTPLPDWSVLKLGVHWQRISGARQTQAFVFCTMLRENDEIPNRSCETPEELVKYIYSKTSSNYHTVKRRRVPAAPQPLKMSYLFYFLFPQLLASCVSTRHSLCDASWHSSPCISGGIARACSLHEGNFLEYAQLYHGLRECSCACLDCSHPDKTILSCDKIHDSSCRPFLPGQLLVRDQD